MAVGPQPIGGLMAPPQALRRQPSQAPAVEPGEIDVVIGDLSQGVATPDGTVVTELPDGSIEVSEAEPEQKRQTGFDENLAEVVDFNTLAVITADIIYGIEDDIQSRSPWVNTYTQGMDLLGLRIEDRSNAKFRKRTSTVRHPALLEAIVKFQSGARAEMLPSAGPAKVRNDGDETSATNEMAQDFEDDLNHYLTTTATEYYPDTDRMLFYLGYGGTTYKKIYRCPIRNRPVSEAVYLPDLIISNEATDLQNAVRVTHQIPMSRIKMLELQHAGFYRDVMLVAPSPDQDPIKMKEREIEGRTQSTPTRTDEMNRTVWECYTYIDPEKLGLAEPGAPKGLPLPYRVSIDKDARACLEIRRAWKQDDKNFRKRRFFVKFGLVPGFGFLDLGYVHLLGNQTRALTAVWRLMIDSGMFASFPGGIRMKGARPSTNEIAPGPGEWVELDVPAAAGQDIRQLLMALPYKDISPVLLQFSEIIGQDAMRMAGAVEMEVGEGRTNVPVGTMMSMIEQQTQVMAAVHKRLHTAQAEELELLRELFAENPEDLWRLAKNPARQWQTAEEFMDLNLVPASDPNVPAQVHRIMQAQALGMLAQQNPTMYDQYKVQRRILKTIGISDADDLLIAPQPAPPPGAQPPNPAIQALMAQQQAETQSRMAEIGVKRQEIAVKAQTEQREAAAQIVENQQKDRELQIEAQQHQADLQSRERIAAMKRDTDLAKLAHQVHQDNQQAGLGTMVTLPPKRRGRRPKGEK